MKRKIILLTLIATILIAGVFISSSCNTIARAAAEEILDQQADQGICREM